MLVKTRRSLTDRADAPTRGKEQPAGLVLPFSAGLKAIQPRRSNPTAAICSRTIKLTASLDRGSAETRPWRSTR